MQTSISALYRTDSGPTRPHAPPLRQLLHHLHTVRRCHLHIAQLVWIHFNMFNLMAEIDARGRVGWSVYISSYWLAHSHVPVTGSLIGSRLLIFHSNRKQMKCPCYMQALWPGQNPLCPFPVFLAIYQCYPFYFFLSPIFS